MALVSREEIQAYLRAHGVYPGYDKRWSLAETALLAHELRPLAKWMFRVIGDALDRNIKLSYLSKANYERTRELLARFPEEKA